MTGKEGAKQQRPPCSSRCCQLCPHQRAAHQRGKCRHWRAASGKGAAAAHAAPAAVVARQLAPHAAGLKVVAEQLVVWLLHAAGHEVVVVVVVVARQLAVWLLQTAAGSRCSSRGGGGGSGGGDGCLATEFYTLPRRWLAVWQALTRCSSCSGSHRWWSRGAPRSAAPPPPPAPAPGCTARLRALAPAAQAVQ